MPPQISETKTSVPNRKSPSVALSGNKNAQKGREVERMLRAMVIQEDYRRIRRMLHKQLDLAAEGDRGAVDFITERLDGKVRQAVEITGSDGGAIEVVQRPLITREQWLQLHAGITIEGEVTDG